MGLSELIEGNNFRRLLVTGMGLFASCLPEGHPPHEQIDSNLEVRDTLAEAESDETDAAKAGNDLKVDNPLNQYDSLPDADKDSADSVLEIPLIFYDTPVDLTNDAPLIDSPLIQYDSLPDTHKDSADADSGLETSLVFYDTLTAPDTSKVDAGLETSTISNDTFVNPTQDTSKIDSLLIQYDAHPETQKDSGLETALVSYDTLIASDSLKVDSNLEITLVSSDTNQSIDIENGGDIVAETQTCTLQTYFQDNDGDGFGNSQTFQESCLSLDGWVLDNTDCNDANPAIYPEAPELCDKLDNQCPGNAGSGKIDEGLTLEQQCGYNSSGECALGFEYKYCKEGKYTLWLGCDALLPSIEICDGKDNDCDGITDNGKDDLCDDELYCNGIEVCAGDSGCQKGVAVDCSAEDLPSFSVCDFIPDNNNLTLDDFSGFISSCDESIDACTFGNYASLTHGCKVNPCEAECDQENTCPPTPCDSLDGCYEGTYREYKNINNPCLEDCTCTSNACLEYIEKVTDNDNDSYDLECEMDCDDNNQDIYPGQKEICDKKDNNCNKETDEGEVCGPFCSLEQLIGYWNFDEGTGTVAHDSSGKNNHGTVNGPIWSKGVVNGALSYDGVNDTVTVAYNSSLDFTTQFTLMAWVKMAGPVSGGIICKRDDSSGGVGYNYELEKDGSIIANLYFTDYLISKGKVPLGEWTHTAVTFNSSQGTAQIYLNGELDSEYYTTSPVTKNALDLQIGRKNAVSGFFHGDIDEAKVYSCALPSSQIKAIYDEEKK